MGTVPRYPPPKVRLESLVKPYFVGFVLKKKNLSHSLCTQIELPMKQSHCGLMTLSFFYILTFWCNSKSSVTVMYASYSLGVCFRM